MIKHLFLTVAAVSIFGCATVTPGPAAEGAEVRKIQASPDSTAIYFCRDGGFLGGGIAIYPKVNGRTVGTLTTKSFTRVDLPPGEYEIALGYYEASDSAFFKAGQREPVKMELIKGKPGEIYHYWLGVAGSSLFGGVLTIDRFDNKAQALSCIENATYVSPRTN